MAPTYAQLQAEPWWSREIYTDAMRWLAGALTKHFGTPAVNAGCKGDNQHLNGGHRSQEWILNSRYCTSRSYTVEGGLTGEQPRYLSALDYTPATREVMLQISQRLDAATRAGHLEEVVEWFGNTNNDQRVDGWNNIKNAVASSDSSHLWHLHLRVGRRWANDMAGAQRIFAVLTSGAVPTSASGSSGGGFLMSLSDIDQENIRYTLLAAPNGPAHVRDGVILQRLDAALAQLSELTGKPAPQASLVVTDEQLAALAKAIVDDDNDVQVDEQTLTRALTAALSTLAARAAGAAAAPVP